jgi:hypothetical protein
MHIVMEVLVTNRGELHELWTNIVVIDLEAFRT